MSLAGDNLHLARRLHGVSMQLAQSQVTAICGPNGAGKSSLLAALAGIITPDRGNVRLDNEQIGRASCRERVSNCV